MKLPFTLAPSSGSPDTRECARKIHADAENGSLIGIAYVAFYKRRNYEVHLCGEADRSPTFTRGAIGVLDDELRDRIHGT